MRAGPARRTGQRFQRIALTPLLLHRQLGWPYCCRRWISFLARTHIDLVSMTSTRCETPSRIGQQPKMLFDREAGSRILIKIPPAQHSVDREHWKEVRFQEFMQRTSPNNNIIYKNSGGGIARRLAAVGRHEIAIPNNTISAGWGPFCPTPMESL